MKNHSQLQEDIEQRLYILKNTVTGEVINVREYFYYYQKRNGNIYPSIFSRQGRQDVEIFGKNLQIANYIDFRNVHESSTVRKKNIFKFLRQHIKDLRHYECILNDKVEKIECFKDCLELVHLVLPHGIVEQAKEKEPGFVEIVFNHQLGSKLIERLKEALTKKVITYRFEENKNLFIKYLS